MLSPQHALSRVIAPSALPITLAEVKAQMRVEHEDDDVIIQRLIEAAVAFVDVQNVLGKAMITQTWAQWMGPTQGIVLLMLGQVQSVTAIKYYDVDGVLQTATLSDFNIFGTSTKTTVSPKNGASWPVAQQREDAIKIEYVIGYGDTSADVPQTIRQALMMLVAHWYENREGAQERALTDVPFGFNELIGIERGQFYG